MFDMVKFVLAYQESNKEFTLQSFYAMNLLISILFIKFCFHSTACQHKPFPLSSPLPVFTLFLCVGKYIKRNSILTTRFQSCFLLFLKCSQYTSTNDDPTPHHPHTNREMSSSKSKNSILAQFLLHVSYSLSIKFEILRTRSD